MPALKLRQDIVRTIAYQGPGGKHQCVYWDTTLECFEPSASDEVLTRKLKSLLALIDVRVLDHLIVADQIFSFANAKLL
jgi:RadC-like JAB domain